MTAKKLTLTRKQYAHLVREVESALKRIHKMRGGGPDDYGAPQTLETYLYQHPMSMIEFYVDDGGIPMGGAGLKSAIAKGRKKFKTTKAKMAKAIHHHLSQLHKGAKKRVQPLVEESKDLLKDTAAAAANKVEQLGDTAIDKMQDKINVTRDQIQGGGHGCGCPTKKKHHHMHGHGQHGGRHRGQTHIESFRDLHGGRDSDTKGGAMAGEDGSYTGHGLMLQQMGFVSAAMPPPAGVPGGFSNHLQTFPVSGPGGKVPAGGFGDYALPVAGGGWDSGY